MIKGIGIDICDKRRIQQSITRSGDTFIMRVLTPEEMEQMPKGVRKSEYVAGRFAAKEAFAKAIGSGIGEQLSWQDIIITNDNLGKPLLCLSNTWLAIHDPQKQLIFHVSISHERDYAVAQVIIEER